MPTITFYVFYASTIDSNLDHNKFDDHFITLMCKHTQIKHVQTFVLEFFILILVIIHETPRNEIQDVFMKYLCYEN